MEAERADIKRLAMSRSEGLRSLSSWEVRFSLPTSFSCMTLSLSSISALAVDKADDRARITALESISSMAACISSSEYSCHFWDVRAATSGSVESSVLVMFKENEGVRLKLDADLGPSTADADEVSPLTRKLVVGVSAASLLG